VLTPIFRSDVSELAPVEALADPKGLRYSTFAGGGDGTSWELRYQRQGSRSSTTTASLSYQDVRDLLIDTQDPALAALPDRVLLDRGHRWVADAAYEQWLSDAVTGRTWVRWQSSHGDFPDLQVTGTEWPYSPEWQAGGRLDYISPTGLRIGLEAVTVGRRFHDPENAEMVGGYSLLNLYIKYQRDLRQDYFVTVTNLTGREYESFARFPQPGRTALAGINYRF
jgi:outer membrane receptor protein involved in Fe transport